MDTIYSICGKHLFDFICFFIFLEVSLKKSMKAFGKAHPEAAKLVSVAREMHALDLLTCHHGDNLACLNISQSLHCMPMIASHADHLPCLTYEAKLQEGTKTMFCFGCPEFPYHNILIPNCPC